MAIRTLDPTAVGFQGLDINALQRAAQEQQNAYNNVVAVQGQQLSQAAQTPTFDLQAKEAALQQGRDAYASLYQKHQGRLGANALDFINQATVNQSNPFFALNKIQQDEYTKQQNKALEYGDRAIMLNDVRSHSLYDPVTGRFKTSPEEVAKLQANVVQASDYTKIPMDLLTKMQNDLTAGNIKVSPTVKTILERYSVESLTPDKILKLVNDPTFTEYFLANTTAAIDNRSAVGYNPETKTNIFTAPPTDSRFKTGVAQFAYGALQFPQVKRVTVQSMTNQEELEKQRRAAAKQEVEDNKLYAPTRPESAQGLVKPLEFTQGDFDDKGKLKQKSLSKLGVVWNAVGAIFRTLTDPTRNMLEYTPEGIPTGFKAVSKGTTEEKGRVLLDNYRKKFNIADSVPDVQVASSIKNTFDNMSTVATSYTDFGEGVAAKINPKLRADFGSLNVAFGGKTFSLESDEQKEAFAERFGFSDWQAFEKAQSDNKGINYTGNMTTALRGGKDIVSGAPMRVQIKDSKNRDQYVEVENYNEIDQVSRHLSRVTANTLASGDFNMTEDDWYVKSAPGSKTPTTKFGKLNTIYTLGSNNAAIPITIGTTGSLSIGGKVVKVPTKAADREVFFTKLVDQARAKLVASGNTTYTEEDLANAVTELTGNTVLGMSYNQLQQSTKDNVMEVANVLADYRPTVRTNYQESKSEMLPKYQEDLHYQ